MQLVWSSTQNIHIDLSVCVLLGLGKILNEVFTPDRHLPFTRCKYIYFQNFGAILAAIFDLL